MISASQTSTLHDVSSPRRYFLSNLRKHYVAYTGGFLAMLATCFTEVATPKFIQWSIDLLSSPTGMSNIPVFLHGNDQVSSLSNIMMGLATLMIVGAIGRFAWRQFLARQTHRAGFEIKTGLWHVLRFQPLRVFERYPLGDLMNRGIGDWNSARVIHGFTMVLTLDVVFFATLGLISMMMIDPVLAIATFVAFAIVSPSIRRLADREHSQHEDSQEALSDLSDFITQSLKTTRLQRATASEANWQERLKRLTDIHAQKRLRVMKTGWQIFPLATVPSVASYLVLCFLGIERVLDKSITPGEFVAMTSYILMMQTPLFELGDCIAEWQKGFASLKRVLEIFQLEPERKGFKLVESDNATRTQNIVSIRDLNFAFSNGRTILQNLNLQVEEGSMVAITGIVGAGKSTLLRIIAGLEPISQKTVMVTGHDASTAPREFFVENISLVPQGSFLFAGSVRDNLSLDKEFSDEHLWKFLDIVEMGDEIRALPHGLSSLIGESGVNLSGGQKQRMTLARALLRPSPILLLDDCLSAVDAHKESLIVANLRRSLRHQTVIWIAHRESTLKLCDRHFELNQGKLVPLHTISGGPSH
jgi:ATP-binding cassette subfamily B multidrug efflux pump